MPTATIPGERFIRTLSHYLDANQGRLIVGKRDERRSSTTSSQPRSSTSSSSSTAPASLYGLSVPYMSLLAAATPTSALRTTSYMPASKLSLDMHHLYFLLVHFEHVGLDMGDPARLGSVPEDGIVNEEDSSSHQDETRSIMSVGSITSTLSLSTGWNFWQRQWSDQQQQQRTVFQDVEHIYQMIAQVDAVRLQMQNTRVIQGYQEPLPTDATFSLVPFKHLTHLELVNVHPRLLADIPTHALTTLIVREAGVEDVAEVITSESDFSQLRMLSLAGNNLITVDDQVTQRIHATVTHLDLSSNMLADVPHALSLLYNLTSLVLAHNMISSVTGINTVLGNIYELDLRGNRLTMLVGLDRLWSLKRLDVRDNRIEDWSELTRLVSLPNLEDVWVAGNPFTVNNDYRVDIFAAFHQHADHDIQLDGSRPSFIERRRIENTPASKLRQLQDQNHAPQPTVATTATAKPTKVVRAKSKRFVKLGRQQQEETPPPVPPLPPSAAAPPASSQQEQENDKRINRATELEKSATITRRKSASSSTRRSRRSTRHRSRSPSTAATATTDDNEQEKQARHRSVSPSSLRRKIESMRQEAGTEWLRVFQEMDIGRQQH